MTIFPEHLFVVAVLNFAGIIYFFYKDRDFILGVKILGYVYAPTILAISSLYLFDLLDCMGACGDIIPKIVFHVIWYVLFMIPVLVFCSHSTAVFFQRRIYAGSSNFMYAIAT